MSFLRKADVKKHLARIAKRFESTLAKDRLAMERELGIAFPERETCRQPATG